MVTLDATILALEEAIARARQISLDLLVLL